MNKIIMIIFSIPILFSISLVYGQEEINTEVKGKQIKVFALDNQVMVHPETGEEPFMMRTNQRSARSLRSSDKVSEIFADNAQGGGRIRSLPGGIIVKLDKSVDAEQWARDHNQVILKKVGEGSYLIKSSSGRKTLDELKTVAALPGVLAADPNWWTKVEAKGRVDIRSNQFKPGPSSKLKR